MLYVHDGRAFQCCARASEPMPFTIWYNEPRYHDLLTPSISPI